MQEGDIYFDIGANYGNRIAPILKIGVKSIIAVEPQTDCCEYLRERFKNITVIQQGAGEKEETKLFYIANENVLSSFSEEFINATKQTRFSGNQWNKTAEVKITTLDKLIQDYGSPKFIKIDVEGYELEVLRGLTTPVNFISFEYTVPELSHKLQLAILRLKEIGNCEFNYSVGESMKMANESWTEFDDMIEFISSEEFIKTGFGDIYVRFN